MIKLLIITNHYEHAKRLIIDKYKLPLNQISVITPETTEKINGLKGVKYLAMRPLYARELNYAQTHDFVEISDDELDEVEWETRDRLTVATLHNRITTEFAQKLADYEDSAAFAYLDAMVTELKERGEDITQYELAFIESETPEMVETENGVKMVVRKRLQLRKIQ